MAFTKPIIEVMQSIRVEAAGPKVTLTAKLKGQGAAFLMPMFLAVGVRRPVPMPPEPVEAVPVPAPMPQKAVPDTK